jgi:gamma-glutamylcyclotransferase (GGCT)/AIG2-like uncharacterized protein YtfP
MNLFTYGSLMFAPVWERVARNTYPNALASVRGFVRHQVLNEDYPGVIAQAQSASSSHEDALLQGRVYRGVSMEDRHRLDKFEGPDYHCVETQTTDGESVVLYIFVHPQRLSAKAWDPQWFEDVGIHRFLQKYPGFLDQ